ncbi:hypothetical protein [Paenibacillus donghaensis]|uniref:HEAT repeat domain-containing protein n=1 Tax=Paenibacillus donghaensis TaxID=414771 RepID=A0A2Z2KWE9_9BACL|nr:hypothetical protein [Paenibacillus donghaensis]ASA25771.1 hypothetical protein B9T62_36610 [Paenibacillus donghaensis]
MVFNKDRMDKSTLLKELDSLGYSDRMNRIALLGRRHVGDEFYSNLLLSLLEEGAYEAHLALTGARATNNANIVLLALKHPKAGVRCRAAGLMATVVADRDTDIEREIITMSYECRRKLLSSIVNTCRQDWAERLLPLVYERWGAQEAALVLSACGEETVRKWLADLGYAVQNWKTLSKRHPDLVAAYFQTTLKNAPLRDKTQVWWRFSSAMESLSFSKPALILECALKVGPVDIIHPVLKKQLGPLVRNHPDAVFKLLTREEALSDLIRHGVPKVLLKRRNRLSMDQWMELATLLADTPMHIARLLHSVAPSKRKMIFEAVYEEDKRHTRIFPKHLLDVLPHELQDQEAARMLGLREIRDDRDSLLRTMARRSIAYSREMLEQASRVSNADERAAAFAYLVKSTALSRRGMEETLQVLIRIKNDQDAVRGAVMTELSSSPPSMFTNGHIEELTVLVDSVVEARDSSYTTTAATEKLALAIIRHQALQPRSELFQFSLRTMRRLVERDGQFTLPSLQAANLPKGAEQILFDELYALASEANKRENYNLVIRLADSFGKRGYALPKLQQLLEEATKAKAAAVQAARQWLAPHRTRDERVKALLNRDKSFITVNEVFLHLHGQRQEWLDPFISGAAIKGKFLTGKTIYLVPATDGFHRWLPRQQKSLAALLERVALDTKRSYSERANVIKIMARMPELFPDKLLELLEDQEVPVAEAVLYALSLSEEPERALPILLDNLDGDQARVAMYAIPKCVRRVSPVLLASLLKELLSQDKLKITVRKEAVRLLGAYRSSGSLLLLLNEYEKPGAHKDVMIAIGHAARQWLDDERGWAILSAMASSPERNIAESLLSQPPGELPVHARSRYLEFIIRIAGHADAAVAAAAFYAMIRWTGGNEEVIAAAAATAVVDLEDSSRWWAAMVALIEACRDGKANEQMIEVYKRLADAPPREEWNAAAQRDMPHRQRLLRLTDQLISLPKHTRLILAPLYLGIMDCLAPHETFTHVVIKFSITAIDWNNAEEAVAHLTRVVNGLTKQPYLLKETYEQLAQNLEGSKGFWNPETILEVVDALGSEEDFEPLYLSVALLEAAGTAVMWSADCANRLKSYRNHKNEAIRSLALDIWTAME